MPALTYLLLAAIGASTVHSLPSQQSCNAPVTPSSFSSTSLDVVIVGGGTAGLVLASRLSESKKLQVGVIEGGYDRTNDPLIDVPNAANALGYQGAVFGNSTYDWEYTSVPQRGLGGRVLSYPSGKVLGGSSAINGLTIQRGSREDYDAWGNAFGNGPEWTFDALLPYFKRYERWHAPTLSATGDLNSDGLSAVHGTDGRISISYNNFFTGVDIPLTQAGIALGLGPTQNPDGGDDSLFPNFGASHSLDPATGNRSYAANGYYGQTERCRSNLHLLTGAVVTRIIWDKKKATKAVGVEYAVGNDKFTVKASKEVVLSAGSLRSPQILELSGVGNKTLLESLNIPVVVDIPQLGENLQEQFIAGTDFLVRDGVVTLDALGNNATFLAEQQNLYRTNKTGAFTYLSNVNAPTPIRSLVTEDQYKTMRAALDTYLASQTLTPLQIVQYNLVKQFLDGGKVATSSLLVVASGGLVSTPAAGQGYISVVSSPAHPLSRGNVHINTTDPLAYPLIDSAFLTNPWDAQATINVMKFVRRWVAKSDIIESPGTPPQAADEWSDDQWIAYLQSVLGTAHHPVGTAAMASQKLGGVVDPRFKVYGLKNVRIVDASVFPMHIGVAPSSTTYMLAEKAADAIKKDLNAY
ncbi:alcohol oxidase [Armillaria gallica]|uniref:Dehydrogenase ARMGADRAFT_1018426 n=1 Tax=Armillaria gallica TaxID=47427 RepID=ARMD5_ARMGA|nr:RecName: Full=Dehydrogenase ARMGADRAFT_1018426; AltName: Full=Melleolide biosynthesis cluster protein ARMGADRAFT_1018426; Flags: Precursor [Armillaria gallica]PBK84748.1 alcohol oxidase [Armillaria gallica]